ncbi:MAG: FkbM family methyltransferase, partial [Halobacteriaceae archaeon]
FDSTATAQQYQQSSTQERSSIVEQNDLPSPTVVKIDVEGAEYNVLKGMGDLLDGVECVYCEIHHPSINEFGSTEDELISLLKDENFGIEVLHQRGNNKFIKAKR